MISNQIIQTSIDELKAITKVDIYVFDLDGIKVAATTEDIEIPREIITGFAASPADSQVVGGYHFLKVLEIPIVIFLKIFRKHSDRLQDSCFQMEQQHGTGHHHQKCNA